MGAVHVVGLHHVAALVHIESVRRIGGIARRVEYAGGGESVSRSPADHFAARREIEVAGGEARVGFFDAKDGGGVGVGGGEADEAGRKGESALIVEVEGGLDENLVEDFW